MLPTHVRTDVTDKERRAYLRRDEYLEEGEEGWAAEARMDTRKRGPAPLVDGDAFDRQRAIPDFDQALVERSVVLVLGTGGVGQDVALLLGRLGVKEIILVDKDSVEASNLNRQCLGFKHDVGNKKVASAAKTLRKHHALRSQVTEAELDAVARWDQVVHLARKADVIFNAIDVGATFDTAVASLAKDLGKPLVVGQSYGWTYTSEFYSGQPGTVGAWDQGAVDRLFSQEKGAAPAGGEGSEKCVKKELRKVMERWGVAGDLAEYCFDAAVEAKPGTLAEAIDGYRAAAVVLLSPGNIVRIGDLKFLPKPHPIPTRFVGSWVVPCMGCAVSMLGQWVNYLTGPATMKRDPPTFVQYDIAAGGSLIETTAHNMKQTASLWAAGMPADELAETLVPTRQFSSSPSEDTVYTPALRRRLEILEEKLFFGSGPVYLQSVPGTTESLCAAEVAVTDDASTPSEALRTPAGEKIVVPEIPSKSHVLRPLGAGAEGDAACAPAAVPAFLSGAPLLKVPKPAGQQGPGVIEGYRSGVRSALISNRYKKTGRVKTWYRLKGCGNRDDGAFPLEPLGDHGELTPRGSGFRESALCEARMCRVIANAGIPVANVPVCFWRYALAGDASPAVEKWCGVFETIGDRRAGDHLTSGLIQLFPLMVPVCLMPDLAEKIAALRRGDGGEGAKTQPAPAEPAEELLPTDMAAACGMPVCDASRIPLYEAAPKSKPDDVLWNVCSERLNQNLLRLKDEAEFSGSILLHVAKRIGWECGDVLRRLAAARVSWGSYKDALGTHCNAHANNLVVDPALGERLLSALDFDMAFDEASYDARKGIGPLEEVLQFEQAAGMRQVLAGSSFASTGVKNTVQDALPPECKHVVPLAFYDTMVHAYDAALVGTAPNPYIPELEPVVADVCKLALCLTQEVVA
ncbi:Adenylyltransferase and sulfurtransferase MOCS3-1 [Diplonema papillatum]|nr:Adenylyltransferase and sulfurtransferase MOCS3-1 [Diplonema papillatum]|eukprot:gene4443-6885_t